MPAHAQPTQAHLQRTPSRWSRKRLTTLLLSLSLMTNAILAAVVVAEDRGNHNATDRQPIISRTEESVAAGSSGERSTVAERKVLALLVRSPAGKLPPSLIDQRTGLAKNNLQAVCRAGPDRSYLCVVRSAQQPWSGLHVRYRPGGNGSLLT